MSRSTTQYRNLVISKLESSLFLTDEQLTKTAADLEDKLLIDPWEGIIDGGGDGRYQAHSGAQAQRDHHQEEEDREELGGEVELGQHFRVGDEGEAGSFFDDVLNAFSQLVGEMAEDGEGDGASKNRGEGVHDADDENVPAGVVTELAVGAVGGQGTEPNTHREE